MNINSPYVITIGRELGSGGKAIAQHMGEQLGIPVYDRRLIMLAAQESGLAPHVFSQADELSKPHGLTSQILRTLTAPFSSITTYYTNTISHEELFRVQADIIRQRAQTENCIIVGRCSDYILRDHPRHLSIFISSDTDDRVCRIAESQGITPQQALQLIRQTDRQRSQYHDLYSETDWGDARSYDICVNTSRLGMEKTAAMLTQYAKDVLNIQK